jgi:hypothetical protein
VKGTEKRRFFSVPFFYFCFLFFLFFTSSINCCHKFFFFQDSVSQQDGAREVGEVANPSEAVAAPTSIVRG